MSATATARCCSPTARAPPGWPAWPARWASFSSASPPIISGRTTTWAPRSPDRPHVHYPQEHWFEPGEDGGWPDELLTPELHKFYNPEGSIDASSAGRPQFRQRRARHLRPALRAPARRRQSSGSRSTSSATCMSATACRPATRRPRRAPRRLSEIFERHIKFRIISEGLCLPDVPEDVIARYPRIAAGIRALRAAGFGILVKDASLGGQYPVMNVTLLQPARPGLLLQLRRPPALRDRAGARPDRTAAGPRAGRAGRLSRTGLRSGRNRQLAQHRNPLRRFQRHHQLELPRRPAGLRVLRLELQQHHRRGLRLAGGPHPRATAATSTSPTSPTWASMPAASWCRACPRSIRWTIWNGRTTASATTSAKPSCTCRNWTTTNAPTCSTP